MIKAKLLQFGFFKQTPYIVFTTTLEKSLELVKPAPYDEIAFEIPDRVLIVHARAYPDQYQIKDDKVELKSFNVYPHDELPCIIGLYNLLRPEFQSKLANLAVTYIVEIISDISKASKVTEKLPISFEETIESFETSF